MIDIGGKEVVLREAIASGFIALKPATIKAIGEKRIKKGDVAEISKAAGVMGAKMTPQNIPFCHPIPIDTVEPEIEFKQGGIEAKCTVRAHYRTGVEMEALSCVNSMLLTIWDMVKYLEKDEKGGYSTTEISRVKVLKKSKGSDGP
jgi:cyclic pyranopterin phosphate synthase